MRVSKSRVLVKHNTILIHYFSHFRTCVDLRGDFFRAQGYSLLSLMVNPALIVPLCNMADIAVKLSIVKPFEFLCQSEKRYINAIHYYSLY